MGGLQLASGWLMQTPLELFVLASGWLARSQWVAYVNSIGLISIVIASGWFTQILLSLFVFCYSQRRISKAEKSAKKALDSKGEKSRVKSGYANYKSNHASFSHVSYSRLGADDGVKSFRPQPFQFRQAAFSAQISVQERNLLRL